MGTFYFIYLCNKYILMSISINILIKDTSCFSWKNQTKSLCKPGLNLQILIKYSYFYFSSQIRNEFLNQHLREHVDYQPFLKKWVTKSCQKFRWFRRTVSVFCNCIIVDKLTTSLKSRFLKLYVQYKNDMTTNFIQSG